MKLIIVVYHDILEDRVEKIFDDVGVDFYTKWERVKGKGHNTDAHLGTRTFPGYNFVRMIAFDNLDQLPKLILSIKALNKETIRDDDKVRVFQLPLEMIV